MKVISVSELGLKTFDETKLKGRMKMSLKNQKKVIIVTFLIIPLLFLVVFGYYPAFKLLQLSFSDWDGASLTMKYIGFSNFIDVFKDSDTMKTMTNNCAYLIVALIQLIFALYLAVVLDGKIRAKNFFKSVVFMPYILNGVAIAFLFNYLYDYQSGPLNILLRSLGLNGVHWLGESYSINFSLAFIGLWRYTGFCMVIFLGALQSIPRALYEAANIDGANFFQTLRYITIPGIKRVIEINILLAINGAMQAYFEPFVITKGGPAGRSDTFITSTLNIAFQFHNFGKASAMAVVLLVVILLIIIIQRRFLRIKGEQ
jgi:raffinose/stachyose/melibiose transport system permease protein